MLPAHLRVSSGGLLEPLDNLGFLARNPGCQPHEGEPAPLDRGMDERRDPTIDEATVLEWNLGGSGARHGVCVAC